MIHRTILIAVVIAAVLTVTARPAVGDEARVVGSLDRVEVLGHDHLGNPVVRVSGWASDTDDGLAVVRLWAAPPFGHLTPVTTSILATGQRADVGGHAFALTEDLGSWVGSPAVVCVEAATWSSSGWIGCELVDGLTWGNSDILRREKA